MKKYKYILTFIILTLTVPNIVLGQTTDLNQKAACNNKRNGDACSYSTSGRGAQAGSTISGFCDRTNGDSNAVNNPLTCRSGDGWKDCVIVGDACLGTTSTPGQRGTSTTTGTCAMRTTPASGRSAARTEKICDTSVKPPGNPGGRSSDGSTGGGTCQDCGGSKCNTGEVCITKEGKPKCESNKCIGGSGAGNGGGGTPPSENTTPTDATAPQTVGFINPIRFNSLTELIAGIINALLGILGAITVAVLVMSGFKYMISSNPGEVGQALDGIKNAIIGLAIIMGAFLITQYVISALAA